MADHFASTSNFENCAAVISTPAATSLLSGIATEAERLDETSALAIEGLLLELSASSTTLCRATMQPPSWLRRARNRIDDASEELPTISELAHEARVHPVHFARVFRRFVGTNPGDYVRRARARRASILLARARLPMSEVALACGFSDQAAFCKAFGRATGLSPGTFRRLWARH
jgi:AraC family transcriptional regulator